tara:strand:+ start:2092 stop:2496 length:405 start_codon:yes stop_codon:yes gene_type:complete
MGRAQKINDKLPPFVALTWEILNSEAYKDITPSAAKALPYFLGKVKIPFNNTKKYLTKFDFSYTEAKRYGFATTTHHRTICQLVEKGFIDPVDRGGLRSDGSSYNKFYLSKRWEKYGTDTFEIIYWNRFFPKDK